jgi:uncharacterized membrane protein YphA (DoxX/SURF4 family)
MLTATESSTTPDRVSAPAILSAGADRWPLINRILFRFAFCFIVLSFFPFPIDQIPKLDVIDDKLLSFWIPVAQWTGAHVLHLGYPVVHYNIDGSGDTTFDYVQALCQIIIAIAATGLWTVLDQRRLTYDGLYRWFRVYVRLALAGAMLSYGIAKILPGQFSYPSLHTFAEQIGDASPMGLLWTFMGYSPSYTHFAGLVETSAGILLLIPRCVTVGALVAAAALTNVVVLNFSYDVPVKLYSSTLLLLALILIAPNVKQLFSLLFLHGSARLSEFAPRFSAAWKRWVWAAAQCSLAGLLIWQSVQQSLPQPEPKPAIFGLYDVTSSNANWRQVIFDYYGPAKTIAVDRRYASRIYCFYGQRRSTLTLRTYLIDSTASVDCGSLRYRRAGKAGLILDGVIEGRSVHAVLSLVNTPRFLLETRGFHWINERPLHV